MLIASESMIAIMDPFVDAVTGPYRGQTAPDPARWVRQAPIRLQTLCQRWGIEPHVPLSGGVIGATIAGRLHNGREVVLKLTPGLMVARAEIAAMRQWSGIAGPEILRTDARIGALLMERVRPGAGTITGPLSVAQAIARCDEVAELLLRMQTPSIPRSTLPWAHVLHPRVSGAENEYQRRGRVDLVDAVRRAVAACAAPTAQGIAHGDFQEKNIVHCARRGLLVVDPFAVVGECAIDAALWVTSIDTEGISTIELLDRFRSLCDRRALERYARLYALCEVRPSYFDDSARDPAGRARMARRIVRAEELLGCDLRTAGATAS